MPGNTSTQYKDLLLTEPCACKLVIIGGLAENSILGQRLQFVWQQSLQKQLKYLTDEDNCTYDLGISSLK